MKLSSPWIMADWRRKILRLLPPLISSFLCFVFVVVRPLSSLGADYAFLCYTALLLYCFPGGTIRGQIQATILGLVSIIAGLAWSVATLAIAAYCGRKYGADGPEARTIIGVGLALLAFIAGFVRSYAPRLTLASRIGLLFPIFLLTGQQGITQVTSLQFLPMLYVALFAAAFGLLPLLAISRPSTGPALGSAILGTLSTIHQILPISLSTYLSEDTHPSPTPPNWKEEHPPTKPQFDNLAQSLKSTTAKLGPSLRAYSNEVLRARLSPNRLIPVIAALKAVARNPLFGSSSHTPGERIKAALQRAANFTVHPTGSARGTSTPRHIENHTRGSSTPRTADTGRFAIELEKRLDSVPSYMRAEAGLPSRHSHTPSTPDTRLAERWTELSRCISAAVQVVSVQLAGVWSWDYHPIEAETRGYGNVRTDLVEAISAFESDLNQALDPEEGYTCALSGSVTPERSQNWRNTLVANGHRENFRLAFYMVSLLDLGRDTLKLLDIVAQVSESAPMEKKWHNPSLPRWIRSLALIKPIDVFDDNPIANDELDRAVKNADDVGDPTGNLDFIHTALQHRDHHERLESPGQRRGFRQVWRKVWDSHRSLEMRINLSRFLRSLRRSRHNIFAFKLTLGISLLSLPALLPPGSPGRIWFRNVRGAWMIISYLYVLDVHTGAIFRIGFFRIVGTFLGAVAGYVCTLIAQRNPYALVTLGSVCSIPISYIILFTSFPGVGTVAGVTLPPLLFLDYLGLSMGFDTFYLAYNRFVNITIGIVAAVLVGSLVWPDHARIRYFSAVSVTLERLAEYYVQLARDNLRSTLIYQPDPRAYSALDASVRRELSAARTLVVVQRNEISLLPRPFRLYAEVLDGAERIFETLTEIRLLRFGVPRRETVLDVLPLRSEFVSAVLMNLWSCGQAFRSRSPLPQFLPSPRIALEEMMLAVDEQKREGRRRSVRPSIQEDSPVSSTVVDGGERSGGGKDQLAMLYAMAEHEALLELCSLIDELVAAARTLFGSQTFLDNATKFPLSES